MARREKMKKKEPRIATITLRDPKYTMSPTEYNIWRIKWDSFWKVVMENALEQIKEEKRMVLSIYTHGKLI